MQQHQIAPLIRRLISITPAQVAQLAEMLIDCVDGGASVSWAIVGTVHLALALPDNQRHRADLAYRRIKKPASGQSLAGFWRVWIQR